MAYYFLFLFSFVCNRGILLSYFFFFYLNTVGTLKFGRIKSKEYPDIEDLFPTESKSEVEPMKDLDLDIERIDLDKFKQNLEMLETQLAGNETRRQALTYHSGSQWSRASKYILKIKGCDLMLQAIYMTRYKIRQLENEKHFNKNDYGYRVAFLYRKLRRLWRKMMDILTMMNRYNYYNARDGFLMHMKIIKIYEDFQYLYWVLIKVDGKYLSRRRTTTKATTQKDVYQTRASRTRTTSPRTTVTFKNQ